MSKKHQIASKTPDRRRFGRTTTKVIKKVILIITRFTYRGHDSSVTPGRTYRSFSFFPNWLNLKPKPQQEVEFAIWCMKRGRSSGMAIAGFVKLCLKPGTKWRDEWENSTHGKRSCFIIDCHHFLALILLRPEQPFNKRKRKPNRTGPGNAGQTKRPRIIKRAGGDARDNLG